MKLVIDWLMEQGFTDDEIEMMIKKNPAKLLSIED
jgi:predicted metal-dependent phosphotriesterase family hydrolase